VIAIGEQRRVPPSIERLFAKADVEIPTFGKMSIGKVDRALDGLDVSQRLQIKATLRQLGIID
jgi:hypothetical protein